jgi:DNA-binding CsgD family transcriptional regulator
VTEDARDPITIALLIDDALLADRVAAVLGNVAGVRLVVQGEPADVVLVSTGNASKGRSPDEGIAAAAADASPSEAVLTPREREVLALLAEGASNKTIARRLGISVHTAKFHVGSLLDKLDATGRTDAVTHAARRGVIEL